MSPVNVRSIAERLAQMRRDYERVKTVIAGHPELAETLNPSLRGFEDAIRYLEAELLNTPDSAKTEHGSK